MLCLATEGYVMSNDMLSPQLHINAYIVCHGFGWLRLLFVGC